MYQILVKDDYTIYTKGITEIIRDRFADTHIAEVSSENDLLQNAGRQSWDIIIVDIEEPLKESFSLLVQIKKASPRTPVIVTTSIDNPLMVTAIIAEGVSACLTKSCSAEDFIAAVENVIPLADKVEI